MNPGVVLVLVVLAAPVAAEIHVEPESPSAGEPVLFSTTSMGNVSWDFSDGPTEQGRRVSHAFSYPGIYRVQVLVDGVSVDSVDVEVPIPPEAYHDQATVTPTPGPEAPKPPRHGEPGFGAWAIDHPFLLMGITALVAGAAGAAYRIVQKRREDQVINYDDEPTREEAGHADWQQYLDSVAEEPETELEEPEPLGPPAQPLPSTSLDLAEPPDPDADAPVVDEEALRRSLEELDE